MVRVLFVDPEPLVLGGLDRMLAVSGAEVAAELFTDGRSALRRIEDGPRTFDAVVTERTLPDLDGLALLRQLQERHPRIVRVLLTAELSGNEVIEAASVAQRILSKPLVPERLLDVARTIERRHGGRGLELTGGVEGLPSPSDCCLRLCMLMDASDSTVKDAAAVVAGDPSLAARVMQVANSPFVGMGRPVSDLRQACGFLGLAAVAGLAVAEGVSASFRPGPPFDHRFVQQVAHRSAVAAWLARRMARDVGRADIAGEAYTAALLADVGLAVLASRDPRALDGAMAAAHREHVPLHQVEEIRLGFHHSEVGADLLAVWGLPAAVVEAVGGHHSPPAGPLALAHLVHAASAVAEEATGWAGAGLDEGWAHAVGLGTGLPVWRDAAAAELATQRPA